ncbi:MAG: serine hydrolase [Phototrophicaceae bacterium]
MARSRLIRPRRKGLPILLIVSVLMILGAIGLFINELLNFTGQEDRLPIGVIAGGVAIGNMTDLEAQTIIEGAYSAPVTLYYNDSPINLIPDEIGFDVNTDVMIANARASGETGAGFWGRFFNYMIGQQSSVLQEIPLVADYQVNALRSRLNEIATVYDTEGSTFTTDLSTLTISTDGAGEQLNIEAALDIIDSALTRPNNRAVALPIVGGEAEIASIDALEELILDYLDSVGYIYDGQNSVASIFILDLITGQEINIQGDIAYTGASTIKVGIMMDLYRNIDREMNRDEAFLMANSMLCSNNSSSNTIMQTYLGSGDIFSGLASVTNMYQRIGANNTYLTAPLVDGSANQQFGSIAAPQTNTNPAYDTDSDPYNQTTAEDMGSLYSLIYDCAQYGSGLMTIYPNGEYTQNECQQMIELMSANDLERLLQAGLPSGTRISHKNGWLPADFSQGITGATTGDAGIVYSPNGRDYVIAVYFWEAGETTGFNRWETIEEISRATWNYFNPENLISSRRTDLPNNANECLRVAADGTVANYNYLPPYDAIDLDNIDGWRNGTATTPQPLPGEQ